MFFEGEIASECFTEILIDDKKIVEIKSVRGLALENKVQLLNYLKVTDKEVGLLLNFDPKPEIKRNVFDNVRK